MSVSGKAGTGWSKIAKNFTISLPVSLPEGGGGWNRLDWVGLALTGNDGVKTLKR